MPADRHAREGRTELGSCHAFPGLMRSWLHIPARPFWTHCRLPVTCTADIPGLHVHRIGCCLGGGWVERGGGGGGGGLFTCIGGIYTQVAVMASSSGL